MANQVWFNIHIPKCAGSSFASILQRNFKGAFGDGRGFDPPMKYGISETTEILKKYPRLRCFSDHKLTMHLPYDFPDKDVRAIAFIREPVSRFISHYFYCRNNAIHNFDPLAKQLTLEDYIQEVLLKEKRIGLLNGQTYQLTGINTGRDLSKLQALTESKKLLLFPVSRFDEACILLERCFSDDFSDCAYVRKNVSIRNQPVLPDEHKIIEEAMALDKQLFAMANAQMDSLSKTLFVEEIDRQRAIRDFENRCGHLHKQLKKPLRRLKQFGLRAAHTLLDDPSYLKPFA